MHRVEKNENEGRMATNERRRRSDDEGEIGCRSKTMLQSTGSKLLRHFVSLRRRRLGGLSIAGTGYNEFLFRILVDEFALGNVLPALPDLVLELALLPVRVGKLAGGVEAWVVPAGDSDGLGGVGEVTAGTGARGAVAARRHGGAANVRRQFLKQKSGIHTA